MQHALKKQQGLTFISLVFVLALIGFFTLLILKIAPIYFDHSKVVNAIEALRQEPGIASLSKRDIESSLDKRFNMNYVNHIGVKDFVIVAQPGFVKVQLDYERVEKIFGNLSVLVEFHEGFEVGER
ncbi:MAG: DUF4845 domain-containing protein [Methylomonas sp.]|nr:DUF4845 domain-containing protein [Methylomonas sp.]PPD21039.1 MAG: DUF4845 domain-containing protein [Methylomonas sp.]PPD27066.1 MAG: DUF4845 domain-containing protein [Methylomonas sp.]PPD38999.1 MAG: DUF4845 domain-containing protein [Methylomonas sp.]PPD40881.1 MAG: DUF4845 domain-containing protein [Methylomonas sp.]